MFGPDHGTAGTAGAPLDTLVEERRSHGIRLSLASSLLAMWADGLTGNRLAAEAAADPANGLAAIAVVGPRRTGHVGRLVEEAERSGAVGYRLDGWDGTTPPPESVHEVLRAVAATGRPLLVPIVRFGAASVIGAATDGLGIPVVLLGAHYMHIVDDVAAAVRYPHLHLETSALAHYRAIETVVGSIGAERVLFGTGSPVRAAASPISAILAASIPDEAKRAILAGNAVRLFGVADGPVDLTTAAGPDRAFDVHTHLGPFDFDVPQVDDADLLGELRVPRTAAAVASAAIAIFGDPVRGNAQMASAAAAGHGGGLYGYVVADPTDLDSTADQLRRYLDAPGVLGVKVHGEWSGTPTTAPGDERPVRPPRPLRPPGQDPQHGGRLGRRPHRDRAPSSAPADRDRPWRPRDAERRGCPRRGRDRQRPPRVREQLRQPGGRFARPSPSPARNG